VPHQEGDPTLLGGGGEEGQERKWRGTGRGAARKWQVVRAVRWANGESGMENLT